MRLRRGDTRSIHHSQREKKKLRCQTTHLLLLMVVLLLLLKLRLKVRHGGNFGRQGSGGREAAAAAVAIWRLADKVAV